MLFSIADTKGDIDTQRKQKFTKCLVRLLIRIWSNSAPYLSNDLVNFLYLI